jgi:hypothetical protein
MLACLGGWACLSSSRPVVYPVAELTPTQVTERLPADQVKPVTQKNTGNFTMVKARQVQKARLVILYNPPDQLKLDMYGLGIHIYSLQADKDGFVSYQPLEKQVVKGKVDDRFLAQRLGMVLSLEDIKDLLGARAAFSRPDREKPVAATIVEGRYVMTYHQPEGLVRYWIEPHQFRVVRKEWFSRSGELRQAVAWSRFIHKHKGKTYPGQVRLELPENDMTVIISFSERQFDTVLAPEAFILRLPPGVTTLITEGQAP